MDLTADNELFVRQRYCRLLGLLGAGSDGYDCTSKRSELDGATRAERGARGGWEARGLGPLKGVRYVCSKLEPPAGKVGVPI